MFLSTARALWEPSATTRERRDVVLFLAFSGEERAANSLWFHFRHPAANRRGDGKDDVSLISTRWVRTEEMLATASINNNIFFLLLNDYFVAQANWSDQLQSVIGQKSREHVQVDSSSSSTGTGVAFLPSPAEVKRWDECSVVLHSRTMTASRSLFFFSSV